VETTQPASRKTERMESTVADNGTTDSPNKEPRGKRNHLDLQVIEDAARQPGKEVREPHRLAMANA